MDKDLKLTVFEMEGSEGKKEVNHYHVTVSLIEVDRLVRHEGSSGQHSPYNGVAC